VDALSYQVYVSAETRQWLIKCHSQEDVVADVCSAFANRFQKTRLLGPAHGKDTNSPIKHLQDLDDLWEARVRHATGWYRLFFRFATIDGEKAAAFGGQGVVKKEGLLPRRAYEVASRRVNDYVDELGASGSLRAADRMK
jgi:hypothetical protein